MTYSETTNIEVLRTFALVMVMVIAGCRGGPANARHEQSSCAPMIARQPASTTVAPGQPAELVIEVTGDGPFTYQWYEANPRGSVLLQGDVKRIAVTPTRTTGYFVWVYNKCGGKASDLATVSVMQSK